MDIETLIAATIVVLLAMAGAFFSAGRRNREQAYWRCWLVGNLLLAGGLAPYLIPSYFTPAFLMSVPNALLVLGFGYRWRAARQFNGRPAPLSFVLAPLVLFVIFGALPFSTAYTVVNVVLGSLAFATGWEFFRDRDDGLSSRLGLCVAYWIIGLSFAARVANDVWLGSTVNGYLPSDTLLAIHLLISVLHATGAGAFALSLAFERKQALLRHAAAIDSLTGLLNRGAFESRLRAALERGERDFSLAVFDVDHFKQVNDSYGHAAGDEALRACAALARDAVGENGMAARIGGEEFALVFEGMAPDEAYRAVERLRRVIAATILTHGDRHFQVSISAGVHGARDFGGDFDALMLAVDEGLYSAKNDGRNRVTPAAA